MRRRFVLLLLLACLAWQGLAVAGWKALAHGTAGVRHEVMHWSGTSHHHHDDGSLGADNSDESRRHGVLHAAQLGSALISAPIPDVAPLAATGPIAMAERQLPAPYIAVPRRPPRAAA